MGALWLRSFSVHVKYSQFIYIIFHPSPEAEKEGGGCFIRSVDLNTHSHPYFIYHFNQLANTDVQLGGTEQK
ncbi:hypothetical protein I7I50_07733 [Histoplasma capsulatum G186AR]|uniref:Uncharacterized protein n=1 Tax=Ajellomyces capsulatus TaxID=5037 RepID=A0A8H8D422_AJECA|nr:hypothetical protein I7I52_09194 [Histoplasma capsulatum]QSS68352.1 hypothetical protein I7I50_07733 [Histoplasma capsulatum G186AR]